MISGEQLAGSILIGWNWFQVAQQHSSPSLNQQDELRDLFLFLWGLEGSYCDRHKSILHKASPAHHHVKKL